jgi:predicted dehydrogenase
MSQVHHIGIIGAGDYGAQHARALQAIEGVRIAAASRTNAEALSQFVAEFGGQGFTDYRELLAQPEIDTVVIATPHHQHTQISLAAARAGKHILLEKPMAPTLAECDQILAAAQAAGVRLMVGHTNRFASTYRIAKALIESGEMGRVVLGTATMQKFWFEPNRRDWHLDRDRGGGVWMTVGIHPLDRLIWLIDSSVETVSARFGTYFHKMQADDTGMAFLRHTNGAASMVISMGYSTGAPKHTTELTCTKGMLSIDYATGVQIGREDRWHTLPESVPAGSWMHEALIAEWQSFLSSIDNDREPPVSGQVARATMEVVFAAERSSAEDREIQLQEPS